MDESSVTIRIKMSNYEVEITGSHVKVLQIIDELPKIVGNVITAFTPAPVLQTSIPPEIVKKVEEKFPTITAPPGMSCPEAIVAILSTDWGRASPKNLGEIMEAMKVNALHFPIGTLKGRLTDLTKKGTLRRIRGEKGYGYVIAK